MAAGNWLMYTEAGRLLMSSLDLVNDDFRIVLMNGTFAFDESHTQWSDISANELSTGGGYTAGGEVFAFTVSEAAGIVTIDGSDEPWASMTLSPAPQNAVIVRDTDGNGTLAPTDLVVSALDLESGGTLGDLSSQTLNVNVHASGMWTFPVPNA